MTQAMKHLLASLRASVRDLGETLLGSELDEQRLRSAKAELAEARARLAGLLSQQLRQAREQGQRQQEQARLEALASKALAQQREDLAEQLADRILALEADATAQAEALAQLEAQAQALRAQIQSAEQRIREFERELQMARTRETVAATTRSVASQLADGEALRRLRERREAAQDQQAAAQAVEDALERQLIDAGLVPDPATEPRRRLLERLRARAEGL